MARESLSLSQQKTLFLQKGLKFKQPQCNVDRSAIKSDNDEERNDEVGGKCVKACLQLHQQSLFVIKLLPHQIKVVLTVASFFFETMVGTNATAHHLPPKISSDLHVHAGS